MAAGRRARGRHCARRVRRRCRGAVPRSDAVGFRVRVVGAAGDAAPGTSTTEPVAPSASAPPAAPSAPAWRVGATPLPLRPDGFGEVLPTPPELVDRRLPTVDVLPPPADGAYAATVAPIDAAVRTRMGETWQEGCPVPLEDLRYLTVGFWGFDDRPHTGELVVHREVADGITRVFGELFAARFPIEQMRLLTTADLTAPPTGDGNVTAAFVCRATRQSTVVVGPRVRPGDRRQPVPQPVRARRVGAARARQQLPRPYERPAGHGRRRAMSSTARSPRSGGRGAAGSGASWTTSTSRPLGGERRLCRDYIAA